MTQKTILQKLGDSLGMILSQPVLDSLNLKEGNELYVTATPEGFLFTSYDPEFSDALEDAPEFMKTHQTAFERLSYL